LAASSTICGILNKPLGGAGQGYTAIVQGTINHTAYEVDISVISITASGIINGAYTGAGTYAGGHGAGFVVQLSTTGKLWSTSASNLGSGTINSDQQSGTVTSDLSPVSATATGIPNSATGTIHITGSWQADHACSKP
jgi:hypothetical protein